MLAASTEILKDHLQSLFLCCGSMMAAAVDALVKSHHFELKLEIAGISNPGGSLFTEIAQRLKVDFEIAKIPAELGEMPWVWLSDHSTKNQRAWIPEMRHREGDFHVLFPFYLQYHLGELRRHSPDFPSPKMDNLYVLLIWAECFGTKQVSLSPRILKDILAWDKTGLLTAHRYAISAINEFETVHSKVASLPELCRLYLGFGSGALGWQLVEGKEIRNHLFNRISLHMANVQQPGSGTSIIVPVLVRNFIWDISQAVVITKNAWALQRYPNMGPQNDLERTQECLTLRLRGMGEDEIWKNLKFENRESYVQWQQRRLIDIDPRRFRDPLEDWQKACKFLGIEPNIESLEKSSISAGGATENSPDEKAIEADLQPFRFSPDFRSIRTRKGDLYTLTEKQAHVITELHKAFENGTPELSQAHLIQEVYGTVAENRLKRLFSDNDIWDALIEQGSKKGLVRLKLTDSDTGL